MPVPFVIGRDLVGEVVRAGPGTGFAAGRQGSFAESAAAADGVVRLLPTTPWRPRVAGRPPLADAAEAHRRVESGDVRGRLLLTP